MPFGRRALLLPYLFGILLLNGCAGFPHHEPIQVTVAAVEPLQGEGLELRLMVKLRVQNPNDFPLDFTGVSLLFNVQGRLLASGVSDIAGRVPRYGETMITVPVGISVFRLALQAVDVMTDDGGRTFSYEMGGTLAGPGFNRIRFGSKGQFTLPADVAEDGGSGGTGW